MTTLAIFGLPKVSNGKIRIFVHAGGCGNFKGALVFEASNDDSGSLFAALGASIEIGSEVSITIMSSGIVPYEFTTKYLGGDISHVPFLHKETNTSKEDVSEDWDISAWNKWNSARSHAEGVEAETQAVISRKVTKVPIQEAFYYESQIDYAEKFHKLWIGLNSYCSNWSSEAGDRMKVLSLVNSPLAAAFEKVLQSSEDAPSAERFRKLQGATGLDMSSDIVRDEIGRTNPILDFLFNAKSRGAVFYNNAKELDGIVFLNTRGQDNVFIDAFKKYHAHMASPVGMGQQFNLNDAFIEPLAPASIKKIW